MIMKMTTDKYIKRGGEEEIIQKKRERKKERERESERERERERERL